MWIVISVLQKNKIDTNYFLWTFFSGRRTKRCSCSHFCKQTGQNL